MIAASNTSTEKLAFQKRDYVFDVQGTRMWPYQPHRTE
jgi:hypothetical protein